MNQAVQKSHALKKFIEISYKAAIRLVEENEEGINGEVVGKIVALLDDEFIDLDIRDEISSIEGSLVKNMKNATSLAECGWVKTKLCRLLLGERATPADYGESYERTWTRIACILDKEAAEQERWGLTGVDSSKFFKIICGILHSREFPKGYDEEDVIAIQEFLNRNRALSEPESVERNIDIFHQSRVLNDNNGEEVWKEHRVRELQRMDTVMIDGSVTHPQLEGWEPSFYITPNNFEVGKGFEFEWVVKSVHKTSRKIEFVLNPHKDPRPTGSTVEIPDNSDSNAEIEELGRATDWIIRRAEEADGGEILLSSLGLEWKGHDISKTFESRSLAQVLRYFSGRGLANYCRMLASEGRLIFIPGDAGADRIARASLTKGAPRESFAQFGIGWLADAEEVKRQTDSWLGRWSFPMPDKMAACLVVMSDYLKKIPRKDWDDSVENSIMMMYFHPAIDNELAFLYTPEDGAINDLSPEWRAAGRFFKKALENMKGMAEYLIEVLGIKKPHYWQDERGVLAANRKSVRVDPSVILDNTISLVEKNAKRKGADVDFERVRAVLSGKRSEVQKILGEFFDGDEESWSQDEVSIASQIQTVDVSSKANEAKEGPDVTVLNALKRSHDSQRKAYGLRELGPLATNPELAMDYVVVLDRERVFEGEGYYDNFVFERFKKSLMEEYNERKRDNPGLPSRSRIIPRCSISDRLVWNASQEFPEMSPQDLISMILDEFPDADAVLRFVMNADNRSRGQNSDNIG